MTTRKAGAQPGGWRACGWQAGGLAGPWDSGHPFSRGSRETVHFGGERQGVWEGPERAVRRCRWHRWLTSPFGGDRPLGLSPSRTWEMCAPEASMTLRKEYDADRHFRHQEEAFSDCGVVLPPGPLAPTPKGPQPPTCTLLEPDQLSPASVNGPDPSCISWPMLSLVPGRPFPQGENYSFFRTWLVSAPSPGMPSPAHPLPGHPCLGAAVWTHGHWSRGASNLRRAEGSRTQLS